MQAQKRQMNSTKPHSCFSFNPPTPPPKKKTIVLKKIGETSRILLPRQLPKCPSLRKIAMQKEIV